MHERTHNISPVKYYVHVSVDLYKRETRFFNFQFTCMFFMDEWLWKWNDIWCFFINYHKRVQRLCVHTRTKSFDVLTRMTYVLWLHSTCAPNGTNEAQYMESVEFPTKIWKSCKFFEKKDLVKTPSYKMSSFTQSNNLITLFHELFH